MIPRLHSGFRQRLRRPLGASTFCWYHRPIRRLRCAQSFRAGSVCLPRMLAAESSSQPWSACGASSCFTFTKYVVMPEHVHLLLSEPLWETSSCRTAPLKPKDGLNGPLLHNGNGVLHHPSQIAVANPQFRRVAKLCNFVPIACAHVNSSSFSRQSGCIVFGLCLKFNQEKVCPF